MSSSFKDLRVWQDAMKFTVAVYRATSNFPKHELYGLSQQLRRAAVSVPSNIAEARATAPIANFAISSCMHEDRCWKYKRN